MNQTDPNFALNLIKPGGNLAPYIQALWSVSIPSNKESSVVRWLQADGCTGIIFNLGKPVYLNNKKLTDKSYILPISTQAQQLHMPAGSKLAGIRFTPGVSTKLFNSLIKQTTSLDDAPIFSKFRQLWNGLKAADNNIDQLKLLGNQLEQIINFDKLPPDVFIQTVKSINSVQQLHEINQETALSQRQVERQFKSFLGITPKHYQRILRVNNSINQLKALSDVKLCDVAAENGFSDQAHMTREFQKIAKITPRNFTAKISSRPTRID